MTQQHFQIQMNRLSRVFANAYNEERTKLLWRELESLSDQWFTRVVDKFIGECRYAPLMPEFREEASKERERTWGKEKQRNAIEAKEFQAKLSTDEMREVCKQIRKKAAGGMSDGDFAKFMANLGSIGRRA